MRAIPRRRLIVTLSVVGVAILAVVAVALTSAPAVPTRVAHPRSEIQGPTTPPATVRAASGDLITCPSGAEPVVKITSASFLPRLSGGTRFKRDTYWIVLTGTVVNETTSPILVKHVATYAGANHTSWSAEVSAPKSLPANSSGRLVIKGTFTSATAESAVVSAQLVWKWKESRLSNCGSRGLIDDD